MKPLWGFRATHRPSRSANKSCFPHNSDRRKGCPNSPKYYLSLSSKYFPRSIAYQHNVRSVPSLGPYPVNVIPHFCMTRPEFGLLGSWQAMTLSMPNCSKKKAIKARSASATRPWPHQERPMQYPISTEREASSTLTPLMLPMGSPRDISSIVQW